MDGTGEVMGDEERRASEDFRKALKSRKRDQRIDERC